MYNTSGMCSLIDRGGHGAKVLKLIVGNEISSVSTRKMTMSGSPNTGGISNYLPRLRYLYPCAAKRWLEKQGHRGRGIDLADIALTAYFAEGNEDFARRAQGSLTR